MPDDRFLRPGPGPPLAGAGRHRPQTAGHGADDGRPHPPDVRAGRRAAVAHHPGAAGVPAVPVRRGGRVPLYPQPQALPAAAAAGQLGHDAAHHGAAAGRARTRRCADEQCVQHLLCHGRVYPELGLADRRPAGAALRAGAAARTGAAGPAGRAAPAGGDAPGPGGGGALFPGGRAAGRAAGAGVPLAAAAQPAADRGRPGHGGAWGAVLHLPQKPGGPGGGAGGAGGPGMAAAPRRHPVLDGRCGAAHAALQRQAGPRLETAVLPVLPRPHRGALPGRRPALKRRGTFSQKSA